MARWLRVVAALAFAVAHAPAGAAPMEWRHFKWARTGDFVEPLIVTSFSAPSIVGDRFAYRAATNHGAEALFVNSQWILDTTTVVQGVPWTRIGTPSVSSNGAVAFWGEFGQDVGIWSTTDGTVGRVTATNRKVPGTQDNFVSFGKEPWISGNNVALQGVGPGSRSGIYAQLAGALTLQILADTTTPVPGGGTLLTLESPCMVDTWVVFNATTQDTNPGLYTTIRKNDKPYPVPLEPFVNTNTPVPGGVGNFETFGAAAADAQNVAFSATGTAGQFGVYLRPARMEGPAELVVNERLLAAQTAGPFTSIGSVSLSGSNVAFLAVGKERAAIYARIDGVLSKVIALGDEIDGRKVRSLQMSRQAIVGRSVAFSAAFEDGSEAVYESAYTEVDVASVEPQKRCASALVHVAGRYMPMLRSDCLVEIDPMAVILSREWYLKWVELRHPHEPKQPDLKSFIAKMPPAERRQFLARAKALGNLTTRIQAAGLPAK